MGNTASDRLKDAAKYFGISIRQFEKEIGASSGWVQHLRKNIDAEKMSAIIKKYPTLNPMWLQYGKGDMILQTGDTNAQNVANAPHNSGTINQQSGDTTLYQKLVKVMEEQIEMLKAEKNTFLAKHGCASYEELEQKMDDLKK